MIGFLNQLSYGTLLYNGSLSLYFLLTTRYGYSKEYIAKKIEPWIHIVGHGFAAITSIVALALDAYDEMTSGTGCWVANYPRGCGETSKCISRLMGWIYWAIPAISVFILVLVFNTMILIFVRQHRVPLNSEAIVSNKTKTHRDEGSSSSFSDDEEENESSPGKAERTQENNREPAPETNESYNERQSKNSSQLRDQEQRLRLLSTQASLYVAFFLVCNVWNGAVSIIEIGGATREAELQLVADRYVFFVLQAIFAPLQGVFNMAVYLRPKLHLCAVSFPRESRLWIFRRTVFGSRVEPTCSTNRPARANDDSRQKAHPRKEKRQQERQEEAHEDSSTRLPRGTISSVTASEGDFDSEMMVAPNGLESRWSNFKEEGFTSILQSLPPSRFDSLTSHRSSLEIISENEASTFEHTTAHISISEEVVMQWAPGDLSAADAEGRWSSNSSNQNSMSSGMSMPKREDSIAEESDQSTSVGQENRSSSEKKPSAPLSADQPVKPLRRESSDSSMISHSNSLRRVTMTGYAEDEDKPMKIPVRRVSLDEFSLGLTSEKAC